MGRNVSLQELVFLQQVVNWGQILAIILRGKKSFHLANNKPSDLLDIASSEFLHTSMNAVSHLREPEVKVLDACVEVLLLVGLFKFLALLCRFVDKELPLFIQSTEACLRNGWVVFEQSYFISYFDTKTQHLNSLLTHLMES